MIEVHENPEEAFSDGQQSLKPERFEALMKELKSVATAVSRGDLICLEKCYAILFFAK